VPASGPAKRAAAESGPPEGGAAAGLRVSIFGALSPIAREIRRQLEARGFPVGELRLYDTPERAGSVTEFQGEAMVVSEPEVEIGAGDVAFVCGENDPRSEGHLRQAITSGASVVDLSGLSRGKPGIPLVNADVNPQAMDESARVVASPQAIAIPLSTILHRLRRSGALFSCEATVLRPVSDFGEEGVDELHRQTVGLLSFSDIPKEVFGRQIAFNAFPASLADPAGAKLDRRVREDLAALLAPDPPDLGVRVLQAPIFYGHAYSLALAFERPMTRDDLIAALATGEPVKISQGDDGRTPGDLGDEAGIWIGELSEDPGRPAGFRLWAVCDALRSGAALNAVRIAERFREKRG
jgi:aspartate-semialdehyde dehydrogenase